MKRRFATADVFTSESFGGNLLAVVLDAEGLDQASMQNIAKEFKFPETTFVLPPSQPGDTAEVRISTPRFELPFAGHPNVGTAFVLASREEGPAASGRLVFEEKTGLVEIDLSKKDSTVTGARLQAPQRLARSEGVSANLVASACSVSADAIRSLAHPPCIVSAGIPFVMADRKTLEALAAAEPRTDVFIEHFPAERTTGIHLYVPVDREGVDIRCRMFAPLQEVPEDPATESANVALIGLLASLRPERDLTLTKTIAQGVESGRPSLLNAEAEKGDGDVTRTWIGSSCAAMMEGTLQWREGGR